MSKRSTFTTITPLPASISRETAISFLHDHLEMIDLNPLIKKRSRIPVPDHASPDEQNCVWYSLTDEIVYIPGMKAASSDVSYTCAFHDLPVGLQTHCYAPMGLDIRDRWSIGGSLPGERPQPRELGLDLPAQGLYLREDVDIRCNILMTSFVKKTLKKSHGALVDRLKEKAALRSSSQTGTPRSLSTDPPTRASAGHDGANQHYQQHYHAPAASPPPHHATPDQGDEFLFPRDGEGQVPWQSLTTKQQQRREKEARETATRPDRAHSQPRRPSPPSASPPRASPQHGQPLQAPANQAQGQGSSFAAELDAPSYPPRDSYADISGKTPFDDKTPDTPSDRNKPFDADASLQQRHPTVLRPADHHRREGSAGSDSGMLGAPSGQQRHPTVLRPGGYTIPRKPVHAQELE